MNVGINIGKLINMLKSSERSSSFSQTGTMKGSMVKAINRYFVIGAALEEIEC